MSVTTFEALHQAIVEALRERFGDRIATYGAYEPWDPIDDQPTARIQTPALLLEVEDFAEADLESPDPLGRLALTCTLAIHCVLSIQTERLQQRLPQLAAAVLSLVGSPQVGQRFRRGNQWGLGIAADPAERPQAQAGEFSPGLHGRDSWLVRWEQTVYLSEALPTT
jgi:hypothetical protein